jgi:hypothetical protein
MISSIFRCSRNAFLYNETGNFSIRDSPSFHLPNRLFHRSGTQNLILPVQSKLYSSRSVVVIRESSLCRPSRTAAFLDASTFVHIPIAYSSCPQGWILQEYDDIV